MRARVRVRAAEARQHLGHPVGAQLTICAVADRASAVPSLAGRDGRSKAAVPPTGLATATASRSPPSQVHGGGAARPAAGRQGTPAALHLETRP